MDDLPADCFLRTEERVEGGPEKKSVNTAMGRKEGVQDQHHTDTSKEHDPAYRLLMSQLTKPGV